MVKTLSYMVKTPRRTARPGIHCYVLSFPALGPWADGLASLRLSFSLQSWITAVPALTVLL